jgi:hypothetical protein
MLLLLLLRFFIIAAKWLLFFIIIRNFCRFVNPVFYFFGSGCKMRAAGNCGQAGSAWRRGIVKGDKLSPLTEVLIRGNWNLREICETAVRHSEKQKKFL